MLTYKERLFEAEELMQESKTALHFLMQEVRVAERNLRTDTAKVERIKKVERERKQRAEARKALKKKGVW